MGELVGMSNPRSIEGGCQWCGAESVRVVTVRPGRVDKKTGRVLELGITARACSRHAALADREAEGRTPTPDEARRKHARGVPQLGLFEVEPNRRSAIHG